MSNVIEPPVSIISQRDAVAARRLCDELGHCCTRKDLNIVAAAISGLISMLPPEAQVQIVASVTNRVSHVEIEQLPIPADTAKVIDLIVGAHK